MTCLWMSRLRACLLAGAFVPLMGNPQGSASQAKPGILTRGRSWEQTLRGGEVHAYRLKASQGDFVKVVAYQHGVDLVLRALDATGKLLQEVDSPNGSLGPEPLSLTIENSGAHRIEVRSLEPGARPGRYRISLPLHESLKGRRGYGMAKVRPELLDDYAGCYEIGPGHRLLLSHNDYAGAGGHLALVDLRTRELKALHPTSDTEFFSGPRPSLEYPVRQVYQFQRGPGGRVEGLRVGPPGGPLRLARRVRSHTQEAVAFEGVGATLKGKLLIPEGPGPFPAVVLIHGSGPATRNMGFYDTFFAQLGLAVLSFDKRGAGVSTGDWQKASFETLAADVLAGVAFLRQRPDIDPMRIGLHGGSQGGWIGALAAARSADVRFLMVTCGSGVSVVDNVVHENEGRLRQAGLTEVEIQAALAFAKEMGTRAAEGESFEHLEARFQAVKGNPWSEYVFPAGLPKDSPWWVWYPLNGPVDPVESLRKVKCPVAWFLADRDWNVPSVRSEARLRKALRDGGNGKSLLRTFAPASHMMMEARTGLDDEREFMTRFVPGYWEAMEAWVRKGPGSRP